MSPTWAEAAKLILALVLLTAGAAKLADLQAFRRTLERLELPLAQAAAAAVALGEIATGGVSLAGLFPHETNLALLAVTALFVVISAYGLRKHAGAPCRCFGSLYESRFNASSLMRSIALLALSTFVASADPNPGVISSPFAALLGSAALLFAVLITQATRAVRPWTGRSASI